ncbi:hypothetical protein SPBR_00132 [Sporothrix brasiliensis 5110]|uniref:DUF8004 domain-containing protein n=1 Tax=Sporothrix brasiliensis 5110 TaxID=1398154 RepID=A0A0C2IZJ7_9PEZI|nr:uncharacterized protein SPBR_00132 [Sporothrix brasiliensis 5110]KIH90397.1 hypothetical protein SPBR_00132 [Sporothrix brasiliensis 5110]
MLSILPRLIETHSSSATLKKTRGRPRDAAPEPQLLQQPQQEPVRQNVVSAPLRLRKSPGRGLSPPPITDGQRGRSVSAQPPPITTGPSQLHSRAHAQLGYVASISTDPSSRSHSTHSSDGNDAQSPNFAATLAQRRMSWLPGVSGGNESHIDYNIDYLMNCQKVPELWDDNGNLYVYLSPQSEGQGASFKVRMSVIEESRVLSSIVQSQASSPASARSRARSFGGRDSLTAADAHRIASPPMSPLLSTGNESRLHLPSSSYNGLNGAPDVERLIALRNLFALLTGQPLVATRNFPTVFAALTQVAELLREFEFGFASGNSNSFGDAVDLSTGFYIDQAALADLRHGREKTLEALVIGEQLRFWPLYNEAFCHAVGKYPALCDLKSSPLWDRVSPYTLQRLERAHLDLLTRQHSVNTRLEQFDFPSLFAGVANSTSNPDYRNIRFKNWRTAFVEMRAFVLRYYKTQFGSWPPKASSRRNPFSESGLNRLVLKTLYADLCSVYDLLVNRNSITTRVGEDGNGASAAPSAVQLPTNGPPADAPIMALRQILNEFDQSSPPVLPPVPFDTPKLPTMATIHETYPDMAPKDQARFDKNVQPYELQLVLLKSHNVDAERPNESPFLAAFEAFELREAKRGKSEAELSEMRIGHWLFLYVVLQSMPMLVIDAPGLRHTEGVEYFLCEPPQGRAPWVEDAGEVRKAWFQTAGGAGPLVELSADVLLYSVEATYHRSHCWLAAKVWSTEAARGSISNAGVTPDDLVLAQGTENVEAAAAAGVPFPIHPVTLPDVPNGSSLGMSSSSPSLVTMATLVSAADSGANASTTSSPRFQPTNYDENADHDTSPRSMSPSMLPQKQGQYSPQLQPMQQLQPPVNLPWSQTRDNYQQLQDRAHLRHASIGWALEPVNLGDDGHPLPFNQQNRNSYQPSTRRIASAGNLRAMVEASGNAVHQRDDANGGGRGADTNTKSTYNAESTFDAILGNMDANSSLAPKKTKKRNSFLPFM